MIYVVATSLLIVFLVLIKQTTRTRPNERSTVLRRPPGPRPLPLIGNIHQIIGGMPHRLLRDLAAGHGAPDLMQLRLGELDVVVVSSPAAAKEIFKTHDTVFASPHRFMATTVMSYGNRDVTFAPYGGYWRQMRRICTHELLGPHQIKSSRAIRAEEARRLVRAIAKKSSSKPAVVNLNTEMLTLANATIARIAFGAECKQGERFIAIGKRVLEAGSGFNLADLYPSLGFVDAVTGASSKMRRLHGEMDEILSEIVEDHRTKRSSAAAAAAGEDHKDLVDVLLSLEEKGGLDFPLTATNIKAVLFDIFLGGTGTIAITLEWAMAELMRQPETMEKAQSEVRQALKGKQRIGDEELINISYLKWVIKETLRLHPPFSMLVPRTCGKSCTLMGYDVAQGSMVLINAWAVGRDAGFWKDGESFRPQRFDECSADFADGGFNLIPFGGGRRICPGIALCVAELELVLAHLLFHFDWGLPGNMRPQDVDMTESLGAEIMRKTDLCLLAKPHDASFSAASCSPTEPCSS